jgi:hypothetical protein
MTRTVAGCNRCADLCGRYLALRRPQVFAFVERRVSSGVVSVRVLPQALRHAIRS